MTPAWTEARDEAGQPVFLRDRFRIDVDPERPERWRLRQYVRLADSVTICADTFGRSLPELQARAAELDETRGQDRPPCGMLGCSNPEHQEVTP